MLQRHPRRRTAALILAVGLVATAGHSALADGTAHPGTAHPGTAGADRELVLAVPNNAFVGFDPNNSNAPRADTSVISELYSSLTAITPELELVGDLATEWTLVADDLWEFQLRDDVVFPNGTPLDAHAVVGNFERIADPELASSLATLYDFVESVEAVGDYTVQFRTKGPFIDLPYRIQNVFIGDPEWLASADITREALGTGPYRAVSLSSDTAVLEANPDYYGPAPAFSRVTYRAIADESARLAGLKSGEIDVATLISPLNLGQLEQVGTLEVGGVSSTRTMLYRFNTLDAPLDDVRVRQALNYAVDKELIAETIFGGYVDPADVFPNAYTDLVPWPYDPDEARRLLAEAGYGGGIELDVAVPEGSYVAGDTIAEAVAAQLGEVGVELNITVLPWTTWLDASYTEDAADLTYFGYFAPDSRALQNFTPYLSTSRQQHGAVPPEYEAAVDAGRTATTEEAAAAGYGEAGRILGEWAPFLLLFPQVDTYAYADDLDWTPRRDTWLLASEFSLAGG